MAVELGVSSGFVIDAPTVDPAGTNSTIDGSSVVTKHTSPEGAIAITEIGWYKGSGTNPANFEIALYEESGGIATTRLFVDATNTSALTGWVSVAVDWAISANTNYWLGLQMDAHSGSSTVDTATTGGVGSDLRQTQSSLLDPYGGGAVLSATGMYAIYAKVSIARDVPIGLGDVSVVGIDPAWSTESAGGGVEFLPITGIIDVVGIAPTALVSDNKNIVPSLGATILNGLSPAVFAGNNKTVIPDIGSALFSVHNPTVFASDNKNTVIGLGELSVIGFSLAIELESNTSVFPNFGTTEINGLSPSFISSDNKLVLASSGETTIIAFNPIWETTIGLFIYADFGEIIFDGFFPLMQIIDFTDAENVEGLSRIINELIGNSKITKEKIGKSKVTNEIIEISKIY